MKMLILTNVYLLIISVSPYCCFGVLSLRLTGGENNGVNYLHNRNILFEYPNNYDSYER